MLTEEEARTKWCPFARVGAGDYGLNRYRDDSKSTIEHTSLCIASQCMAWRFNSEALAAEKIDRRGYCGLAGAPT